MNPAASVTPVGQAERPDAPGRTRGGTAYHLLLAAVLLLAVVPIWMVSYPGLMDAYSHLTRCYILAHFHSDPFWAGFYRVEFGPIPNLAIDAVVAPLAGWLPLMVAAKIFYSGMALLFVLGCDAIGRAARGRPHWLALVAGLAYYNSALLWGFVNYLFGVGLLFCAFAFWLRRRGRLRGLSFAVLCILSCLVYLAHLGAVAVLGVACLAIALLDYAHHRRFPRLLLDMGWMVCPTLLLVFGFLQRNGRVGQISWGTPFYKLSLFGGMIRTYNLRFDAAIALGLALCALVLLYRCRFHRELLLAGLVLLGFAMIMPMNIFTANGADARFIVPGCVLLVLSLRPRWGRAQIVALTAALLLMTLRVAAIGLQWQRMDPINRQVLALGAVLPAGARVDVLETLQASKVWDRAEWELYDIADLWSVHRHSYESNVFALAGQQPLIQLLPTCWPRGNTDCARQYDYAVTIQPPRWLQQRLEAHAQPVAQVHGLQLWKFRAAPPN